MATETEDNDASLGLIVRCLVYLKARFDRCRRVIRQPLTCDSSGDILQASDDLSRVINSYKEIVEGQPINGDSEEPRSSAGHNESGESPFNLSNVFAFYIKT